MKQLIIFSILLGLMVSCKTIREGSEHSNSNNMTTLKTEKDGLSYENAILIDETSESAGVKAEYDWLKKNYPGYKLIRQSLNFNKNKNYDIINIETAERQEKNIYFDISNFFGKF